MLVLSTGTTNGLGDTTVNSEAEYSINFSEDGKKLCLSLHYNGSKVFCLLME